MSHAANVPVPSWVALSVKQPWAALLVAGLKTVEIRTWPTRHRGRVLIHASKLPDDRPEGWAAVRSPQLQTLAALRGGVIGLGQLTDCRAYTTPADFAADVERHHNVTDWFRPPCLYGHVFTGQKVVPFFAYPGQTLYFEVKGFVEGSLPEEVLPPEAPRPPRRRSRN